VEVATEVDPGGDDGADDSLNLMDVCQMLKAEWKAVSESTIAQCWLKADLLRADVAATLRGRHGLYHSGLLRMDEEVSEIVSMMREISAGEGPDTGQRAAERTMDAAEWLAVEELPETVFDTAVQSESEEVEEDE